MSTRGRRQRLVRRFLPSVVPLSHRKAVTVPLDLIDRTAARPFREFRALPPNRLRIRVGVGDRLLFNHPQFLTHGADLAIRIFALGLARFDSSILEIGCGCGRLAMALQHADSFTGQYTGTDVDAELVAWCDEHLGDERFRFIHSDIQNPLYNPGGVPGPYTLPLADESQQLVISHSVFTHLLEDEVKHYLEESHRVLDGEGHVGMSVFCLEDLRERGDLGGRWSFEHRIGSAFVESLQYPEAAVAYERGYLEEIARAAGFREASVQASPSGRDPQSFLVCNR
jgi:ubiquinone/menaquinone biosynthesis C-methylase UbiE